MPDLTAAETEPMRFPVRCPHCRHLHDGAMVTVVQRYLDCSTWRCPSCTTLIDDRPRAWGGCYQPGEPGFDDEQDTVDDLALAAELGGAL